VKTLNTSLLFMSDHGESLGENGIYLHGLPYMFAPREQTHVPFIVWMPEAFDAANGIDASCVSRIAHDGAYGHENLFDTLLGAFAVQTGIYRPELDVFRPCRKA
jgi:lipid A ethanolaminephosphotransferase